MYMLIFMVTVLSVGYRWVNVFTGSVDFNGVSNLKKITL